MALAMQPSHNSAWEESIVPALRKRLENESRILSQRISIHSTTTDGAHQSVSSAKPISRSPTPSSRPPSTSPISRGTSDHVRPSGIPRPSVNRDLGSGLNINGPGNSQSAFSPSSSNTLPGKRARTRSTPYISESDSVATALPPPPSTSNGRRTPNGATLNGIPTPASSRAASPMVNTRPADRPSRIPTATGKRARSSSNAASTDSHFSRPQTGRKASAPVTNKPRKSENVNGHVMFPPSPETSPDLWLEADKIEKEDALREELSHFPSEHKIRDETPPFNPNRVSRVPSFEEREFEHWYRGDVSRNGGRGEIKVGKGQTAKEMLEIAIGGHRLDSSDNWQTRVWSGSVAGSSRDLATDEGRFSQDDYASASQQNSAEYYEMETNELHDDQMDEDDTRQTSSPTPDANARVMTPETSSSGHRRTPSASKVPQPTQQPKTAKPKTAPTTQAGKLTSKPAGKTPSTPKNAKTARPRQRVVSKGTAAADSRPPPDEPLPPWAQRQPPPGNWDEVVLPTVAKKMGLTPEITMLGDGTSSKGKRSEEEEPVTVPGMFGFDPTKIKTSGPRSRRSVDVNSDNAKVSEEQPPQSPLRSVEYEYTPPRSNSPPPFSSYITPEERRRSLQKPSQIPQPVKRQSGIPPTVAPPPQPPKITPTPVEEPTVTVIERRAAMEKMQPVKEDGGDDAGCCKCTIM
ncbi:hypothetical protein FRC03_006424 [Tulasnella sp. 419]|nr:hypothetical protein FRC03_006424 [Tulasnella sp. 419]